MPMIQLPINGRTWLVCLCALTGLLSACAAPHRQGEGQDSQGSQGSQPSGSSQVAQASCGGVGLPAGSTVHPGDSVRLSASGFSPATTASLGFAGQPAAKSVMATANGVLVADFTVASSTADGSYVIAFQQQPAPTNSAHAGNTSVTIPRVAMWRLRVDHSAAPCSTRS